jgi:hypothetical protein
MTQSSSSDYPELPLDLEDAQSQAMAAVQRAVKSGYQRLQIDILIPDLKPEILARPFLQVCNPPLLAIFSDAGGAALAQRDWMATDPPIPEGVVLESLSRRTSVAEDQAVLFVTPAVYGIEQVEEVCNTMSRQYSDHRPVVLLNPQLQDAATVGVGLSGRRFQQRFMNTFEPCYFLRPLGNGALFRVYPHPWTIWEQDSETGEYYLLETTDSKPSGEDLAEIFARNNSSPSSIWAGLRRFFQALQR